MHASIKILISAIALIPTVGCKETPRKNTPEPKNLIQKLNQVSKVEGAMVEQWSPVLNIWEPVIYVHGFNDNMEGAQLIADTLEPVIKLENHPDRRLRATQR